MKYHFTTNIADSGYYCSRVDGSHYQAGVSTKKTPVIGETWYYKVPGSYALLTGTVDEMTMLTVVLSKDGWSTKTRYSLVDVDFVEKKSEAK